MSELQNRKINIDDLRILSRCLTADNADDESFNLTKLHGFLCSVVSAPSVIAPEEYINIVFENTIFKSEIVYQPDEEALNILVTLKRFYDNVVDELCGFKDIKCTPLLWENNNIVQYDKGSQELIGQWCDGYLKGCGLDSTWTKDETIIAKLIPMVNMASIVAIEMEGLQDKMIKNSGNQFRVMRATLPMLVQYLFEYWVPYKEKNITAAIENADKVCNTKTQAK